jgi:hypothetical protein
MIPGPMPAPEPATGSAGGALHAVAPRTASIAMTRPTPWFRFAAHLCLTDRITSQPSAAEPVSDRLSLRIR